MKSPPNWYRQNSIVASFNHFCTLMIDALKKCYQDGTPWQGVLCSPRFNVEVEIKRVDKPQENKSDVYGPQAEG